MSKSLNKNLSKKATRIIEQWKSSRHDLKKKVKKLRKKKSHKTPRKLTDEEINGTIISKPVTIIKVYSDKEIEDFLREDSLTPKERSTIDKNIDKIKRKAATKR